MTAGIPCLATSPSAFSSPSRSPPSSVRAVNVPLTHHLEQLDAVEITGRAVPRPPIDTKSCRDLQKLKRPAESEEETFDWQRLSATSDMSLVYSAHHDTRWLPVPLIQIIGVSSQRKLTGLVCRMWFADSQQPVFSAAIVQEVTESHGRRFDSRL